MRDQAIASLLVSLALAALLGGCAVTQPQNTPVTHLYRRDPATGRGYYIYVPSTYRSDRPMPLIVSCHGTPPYDVANDHIREWKMLAEQNGCIVVAPELKGTDGLFGDGPLVGMYDCERVILSLISLLQYRYNVDRANVMLTGFSGGGFPTYWVGLRHPDIFSTLVVRNGNFSQHNVDGWYPPDARLLNILIYYGSNDPGAIRRQSRRGIAYLESRGFRVQTAVLEGAGHERRPEVAMEYFRRHWRSPQPALSLQAE